ncbi:MFS transporter [Streptomyces vinaceus]|uniref:MFS transporter n=1 Tax=Streptomyces vinaceus TaxID=1960 RepID=UPI003696AD71
MGHIRELTPQQRAALVAMVTAASLLFSSLTSIIVALPVIQRELGLDSSELHWVVVAALLPVTAFAVVSGRLGDIVGRRKVLLLGIVVFGIGSALCAIAPDGTFLVAARAVQGLGVALAVPLAVANLTASLPEHSHGWAVGVQTAGTTLFGILVPLGIALLVQFASWRWAFAAAVPATVLVLALTRHALVESRAAEPGSLDVLGAVLIATGLTLVVLAFERSSEWGYVHYGTLLALIAGVALLSAFVRVELRAAQPLLDLRYLLLPTVSRPMAALALLQCAGLTLVVYGMLYFQHVLDFSVFHASLLVMATSLGTLGISAYAGQLTDRGRGVQLIATGLALTGCTLLWLALGVEARHGLLLLPALMIFGLAPPLVYPSATMVVMTSLPGSARGVGASLSVQARQLGASLGLALTNLLFTAVEWGRRNALVHPSATDLTVEEQAALDDVLTQGRAGSQLLAQLPDDVAQDRVRTAADDAFTTAFEVTLLTLGCLVLLGTALMVGALAVRRRRTGGHRLS